MVRKIFVPTYGLSGAGKDTIINKILALFPEEFHFAKSWSTRKPRFVGEDCHIFVTDEQLNEKLKEEKPVTGTNYGGARYILFASEMDESKINIRPIDPLGIFVCGHSEKLQMLPLEIFCYPEVRFKRCVEESKKRFLKKEGRDPSVEELTDIAREVVDRLSREKDQYEFIQFPKSEKLVFGNSHEKDNDDYIKEIVKKIRLNISKN